MKQYWKKTKNSNAKCRRCFKDIPKDTMALVVELDGPMSQHVTSFFCDKDGQDILNEGRALMEARDL